MEKIPGGNLEDSRVLKGVMMNKDLVHSKMRRRIVKPRILLLDCTLEYKKNESQTNIEMSDDKVRSRTGCCMARLSPCMKGLPASRPTPERPCQPYSVQAWEELLRQEEEAIKEICSEIVAFKPDIVVTEKGVSDLAQHYLVKANISVIRRIRKTDNNRIARATGATIVHRTSEIQEKDIGTGCGLFECTKIGDEWFSWFVDCEAPKACSIVLRGANKDVLNEVRNPSPTYTRSLHHQSMPRISTDCCCKQPPQRILHVSPSCRLSATLATR